MSAIRLANTDPDDIPTPPADRTYLFLDLGGVVSLKDATGAVVAVVTNPLAADLDAVGNAISNAATITGAGSQNMTIRAGNGAPSASGKTLVLLGGTGDDGGGTGGGKIRLTGGGDPNPGLIVLDTLPTDDPAVAGALWLDSGVLSVSAGGG